jgi:flagellar hook-basal body complex protein FliE
MNNEIRHITGLPDNLKPAGQPTPAQPSGKPSFSQVIGKLVQDVDQLHKTAENTTEKMITGQLQDVHQVVVAMEEAQTSFRLLMEVRNKMIDAYREVMRMQI